MDDNLIIVTSVLGCAWLALLVVVVVLWVQLCGLKKKLAEAQNGSRMRVQKLKINNDKNHAFHNAGLAPDEELSRRGYSMYMAPDSDLESGRQPDRHMDRQPDRHIDRHPDRHMDRHSDRHMDRPQERQTGGQFVDELIHELDNRQHRQSSAPPFLLQSIQDNKMKNRNSMNPVGNGAGRQSDTNPNFIY